MALALAYWIPSVLLVGAAVLCAWKWRLARTCVVAAIVALGVAGWEIYVTMRSIRGQSWDPLFHGLKLGVLAVVVVVDLAAVWSSLRLRSAAANGDSRKADGALSGGLSGRGALVVCVFLLMLAALLYPIGLPLLATSGE